jgi:hypothetical protein
MPKPATTPVEVVITIADSHTARMAEVVKHLQAAGLNAPHSLPSAGIVTGQVSPQQLKALRQVAGVQAVEASGDVQLAPPDAGVQ